MAYKTKELEAQALKAVKKHKLCFIDDIISYLPCSRQAYYNHNLDKNDDIKKALTVNRVSQKRELRSKWMESNQPSLQMALYKLLADDDERKRLSMSYVDHTNKGEAFEPEVLSTEELILRAGAMRDLADKALAHSNGNGNGKE